MDTSITSVTVSATSFTVSSGSVLYYLPFLVWGSVVDTDLKNQ